MTRTRLAARLLLAAGLLFSAGCSGDSPTPNVTPTESVASSPTKTPSPSATQTPPMSKRAKEAAFIERFFAAISTSISDGHSRRFMRFASQRCLNCRTLAANLAKAYADGGYIDDGEWTVTSARFVRRDDATSVWNVNVKTARERWFDARDQPVKIVQASTQRPAVAIVATASGYEVQELRLR